MNIFSSLYLSDWRFALVYVCNDHVNEGLKLINSPHVQKLSKKTKKNCYLCNETAEYFLFHYYSLNPLKRNPKGLIEVVRSILK